jgi:hypothetical protein
VDDEIRKKILALLEQHRIMTIATLRPDGWPQATTVGYANDGLTLYFLCGPERPAERFHRYTGHDVNLGKWPLGRQPMSFETSMPGVFAVGDVRLGSMKRVASAVGEGAGAVQNVHQYLQEWENISLDVVRNFPTSGVPTRLSRRPSSHA